MKSLIFGALVAAAPLALLLPGCSGGALPGNPFPTTSPTTAPTSSPTATPPAAVTQTSNFTLGNGQRAILKTSIRGTAISGTMQILAPLTGTRTAATLTRSIKIGTFSITGTFTPERSFNITVKDGNTTLFTMNGLLPTATQTGNYNLTTADGQTDSGTIPAAGSVSPTATPRPTPTSVPGNSSIDLSFIASGDANYVKVPLKTAKFTQASGIIGVAVNGDDGTNFTLLTMGNINATQGASITFTPSTFLTFFIYDQPRTGVLKPFFVKGGTVTLSSLTATTATFTFKDVLFVANEGSAARGTITVNGTVSGPLTKL